MGSPLSNKIKVMMTLSKASGPPGGPPRGSPPGHFPPHGQAPMGVRAVTLPDSGCCNPMCTCAAWCCPWVYHSKVAKFVGLDEDFRCALSACLFWCPCTTFSNCWPCGLYGLCGCQPDVHGCYHGSTVAIKLREQNGIEVKPCGLICFNCMCAPCALTHDKMIMDALKAAGIPGRGNGPKRQFMMVEKRMLL